MDLKQAIVNNNGMSQDMSISKQDDKFAFENKNIRIQATDDGTLLSITNLKNPKPKNTVNIPCDHVFGSCVTPEYLVLFCKYHDEITHFTFDRIYRIDLKSVDSDIESSCKILYSAGRGGDGSLNFNDNSHFDTIYYEEAETVKKVYWVDGINKPRVINLITPKEIETNGAEFESYTTNVFEFYPTIYEKKRSPSAHADVARIPEIRATKNRNVASELPAGIIQYFMSYYTINGAETLIAASSDTYTIDFSNRGAKADESGMCAFDVEIPAENVNTKFDYIRVYSALRTIENGPLTVKIVGDIRINKNPNEDEVYKITDNGINQEQLQDEYIYFIGGTPFIAKTLTEKDGTAFFGNIKTESVLIPDTLRSIITDECFEEDERSSKVIKFSLTKEIPLNKNQFGNKYPYSLQLDKGSKSYKTFKSGECYRFGIQFQTLQGQWSDVAWIGDVECTAKPIFDSESQTFKVNDVEFVMPIEVRNKARDSDFVAYRILYADPENSNGRRIKAQGILCPTMFTPGQRALNSPYSLPSWIMRPKNPKENGVAYHHFEPIFSSVVPGGEIASYTPSKIEDNNILYTTPYYEEKNSNKTSDCYLVTYVVVGNQNKLIVRSVKIWADEDSVKNNFYTPDGHEPSPDTYEVMCDYCVPYGGSRNEFNNALEALPKSGYHNNPYGYYKKTDGKIEYIQHEVKSDYTETGINGNNVIGWKPMLRANNLPEDWAPEPKKLDEVDHRFEYAGSTPFYNFIKYVNELQRDNPEYPYKIGEHLDLRKNAKDVSSSDLANYFIEKGFFPLFGRTTTSTVIFSDDLGNHSGSNYDPGLSNDYIYKYENHIFSTIRTTYIEKFDTGVGRYKSKFMSIPEIFRPRCTVSVEGGIYGNEDSGWGTIDQSLYAHFEYNWRYDESHSPEFLPYRGLWGTWDYFAGFIQIMKISDGIVDKKITETYNDYYVDESIVTLNSPDIDSVPQNNESIKLNIVGVVPFDNCQVNYDSTVEQFASPVLGSVNTLSLTEYNNKDNSFLPFYSDFMYSDLGWSNDNKLSSSIVAEYNTYLFGANNFLGVTKEEELESLSSTFSTRPGTIKKQQVFNEYFSNNSLYFANPLSYGNVYYAKTDETGEPIVFRTNKGNGVYRPFYSNLVVSENTSHIYDDGEKRNKVSLGNSMIKFSTSPHVVLNFQDPNVDIRKYLLPHFEDDNDYYETITDTKKYVWSGEVQNVSIDNIPQNMRGEWSKSETQDDTITVKSIWEEYDPNTLIVSEDYFLPVSYFTGISDDEAALICSALGNVINTSQKIKNILSNNYTFTNNTYTIINNDKDKIISAVYVQSVLTIITEDGARYRTLLTTKKGYIESFSVTINSGTEEIESIDSVNVEYYDSPIPIVETEKEQTDISSIYLYSDDTLKLYFKWYNGKTIYEGTDVPGTIDYLQYIEKIAVGFPITYVSKQIGLTSPTSNPYVYLGEIYNDIDEDSLYGGTDVTALRKLSWIPSSNIVSIYDGNKGNPLTNMEGDTYYQRWDCLKTFPTSEEDINQIVDITSFMVETHKNLDGRSDINRVSYSLMARPSNFNLFNDVYNQKNNIFEYTVRWTELNSESIPNQIVWSMTKNILGDVDTWTNTNISSSTRVSYPVTKLTNYNNTVMALTEHSVEAVNFNTKQLVPATDNSFIELQNSSKVDGTTKLQVPYGSHNMSTLITEKGFYFIDDNEKSLIRLGGEAGITKIGAASMTDWLKNNIVQGTYAENESKKPFRLEYDIVHKDIYIINDEYCLVYNETLDAFISFITYSGEYWLYNYNGKLFAYRLNSDNKILNIYEMYAGDSYNGDFQEYNNEWLDPVIMEYSVWYRINPGPYSDKVFTNGTLMADIDVTGTNYSYPSYPNGTKTNDKPFNTLRVWTEYQDTTEVPLEHILDKPSLLKQKFRFWRFIIPRDVHSPFKRDRIRNPWIHLQLKGNSTKKMEFHNLTIQYME